MMAITIHKFLLGEGVIDFKQADVTVTTHPVREWLYAGHDPGGRVCAWAKVEAPTSKNFEDWRLMLRGTGHDCDDTADATHVGSMVDGPYVWHVFAKKEG